MDAVPRVLTSHAMLADLDLRLVGSQYSLLIAVIIAVIIAVVIAVVIAVITAVTITVTTAVIITPSA